MASTIILKKSSTAGAVPLVADLEQGEVALNLVDRKLYTKNNSNVVIAVGNPYVSSSVPPAPAQGDLWYDTVADALKTFDGAAWQSAGYQSLSELEDVSISSAANNNLLQYNGTEWVNRTYSQADVQQASNTEADARAAISVTDTGGDGSLSYNQSTGTITYTGPSAAEVRAHFSAAGDLAYNSATGVFSVTTYKTADFNADFANRTTDDLAEGSTNQYFTTARARNSISVTDAGGDGSLTYSPTTGVITYTGPSASEVRAHFSGGTGVTLTDGVIAIGQEVNTDSNVTFNDVIVDGDLTVNGTVTTVNSTEVEIGDNIIVLNSLATGTPTADAGIEINRGSSANVQFIWNEANDRWTTNGEDLQAGTFIGTIDGGSY
jgi:hypothetical protein